MLGCHWQLAASASLAEQHWRTSRQWHLSYQVCEFLPIMDDDLPATEDLMETYRDRPMDFADATLVHLARRENLTTVFTIDHDDFETFRIGGRRHFLIVPGR